MKISIIIPVYNVEQYVVQCLQSVTDQTWKDGEIECIVVDDCGTDRSMALVEEFLSSYSGRIDFKVVRHEMNRGISAARNSGMDIATGDYLTFIDSDDFFYPDALESYTLPIKNRYYDVVMAPFNDSRPYLVDETKNGEFFSGQEILSNFCDAIISEVYNDGWYCVAWNKLYRSAFIRQKRLKFIEGLLYEDVPWNFISLFECNSVFAISTPVLYYRIRSNSIMTGTSIEKRVVNSIFGHNAIYDYCVVNHIENSVNVWRFFLKRNNLLLNIISEADPVIKKSLFYQILKDNHCDPLFGIRNKIVSVFFLISHMYIYLPKPLSYYYWVLYQYCKRLSYCLT